MRILLTRFLSVTSVVQFKSVVSNNQGRLPLPVNSVNKKRIMEMEVDSAVDGGEPGSKLEPIIKVDTNSDDKDSKRILEGMEGDGSVKFRIISEGKVRIPQSTHIFYNPTQEFNRDISIVALQAFIRTEMKEEKKQNVTVFEAMSASGIRACRYAKEVEGLSEVIANDLSKHAVETVGRNAELNQVSDIVRPSHGDACAKMYERKNDVAVVDLDPYGTPAPFLDAALQCVADEGLLMVTATDMAILAGGNHAESCFAKYGSMSVKSKACHEIALRIVVHTVQATANRYGLVALPLLSLSVDFYVRLFFKIFKSPKRAKQSALTTSMIYQCSGCRSITLQHLASLKKGNPSVSQGPPVSRKCDHCVSTHHIAGPIWSGPIHNQKFVTAMMHELNENFSYLGTFNRIKGMLGLVQEELPYQPLFYKVAELCSVLKASTIPMMTIRSAIMNMGYQVSNSHTEPNMIKSNIPNDRLWDILVAWRRQTNPKPLENEDSAGFRIMSRPPPEKEIDFTIRADAKPMSQHMNLLRYQNNPEKFWGPGCKDNFKSQGQGEPTKRELNQGKRKKVAKEKNKTEQNN